jgi:tetratricopeptide (TPR) repeat protein
LTEKLEEMQRAYEQDFREESNVFEAYAVFSQAVPLYESYLNQWVAGYPSLCAPYVARAEYYSACASAARGAAWASETSESQFKSMERYFSLALQDIESALKINPKMDVCYAMLIRIGMCTSNDALKLNSLKESLKNNPYGFEVRKTYLYSLTPRWGGSYNQMEEFVNESERYLSVNPDIKRLRAMIAGDKANILKYDRRFDDAILLYNDALQITERAVYYAERGECYYWLKDYKRAMQDLDHAISLDPKDADYLRWKSKVLYSLNRMSDAQELIEQAEKLDPTDKWVRQQKEFYESDGAKAKVYANRGYEYLQKGQYESAVQELNEALKLNGEDYISYYNRGVCFYYLQLPDKSLADLHQVIARKREYTAAYRLMGKIEFERGNYDNALEAMSFFLKLDNQNGEMFYNRALTYWKKGMKREAADDAQRSCALGFQHACQMYEEIKKE